MMFIFNELTTSFVLFSQRKACKSLHLWGEGWNRSVFFTFILLLTLGFAIDLSAQTKEMESLWKSQIDTGEIRLNKSKYLEISEEKALEVFDNQPNFGMYHDNYFITGVPTNTAINKHTADAKFQISIRQRLMKTHLPFNTFLMLTYTQKSFWNIYENSSPFGDNNYNPGIVLTKPIIRNNKLRGVTALPSNTNQTVKTVLIRAHGIISLYRAFISII